MNSNEMDLRIINFLRFPMTVGIVFIHTGVVFYDGSSPEHYPIYNIVRQLLSEGVARLCVPLFFFISGYLMFFNVKKWSYSIYIEKLKRRVHSLLIPYIFFNIVAVGIIAIGQHLYPSFISGAQTPISDWSFNDILFAFTGPFVRPLWFVLHLMLLALFTPPHIHMY